VFPVLGSSFFVDSVAPFIVWFRAETLALLPPPPFGVFGVPPAMFTSELSVGFFLPSPSFESSEESLELLSSFVEEDLVSSVLSSSVLPEVDPVEPLLSFVLLVDGFVELLLSSVLLEDGFVELLLSSVLLEEDSVVLLLSSVLLEEDSVELLLSSVLLEEDSVVLLLSSVLLVDGSAELLLSFCAT
jgi:hypothetical protein